MAIIHTYPRSQSALLQQTYAKDDINIIDSDTQKDLSQSKPCSTDDLGLLRKHHYSLPTPRQYQDLSNVQKGLGDIKQLSSTTSGRFQFQLNHPSLEQSFRFQTFAEAEQFRLNPHRFFLRRTTKPMALPMKLIRGHDNHDVKNAIAANSCAAFVIDGADDAAIGIKNLGLHELISAALQVSLFGMFAVAVYKGERGALDEYQELLESIKKTQTDTQTTIEKINRILKKGDQQQNLVLFKRILANEAAAKETLLSGKASIAQQDSYLEHLSFKQDMLKQMLECVKSNESDSLIKQAQQWNTQLDNHLNKLDKDFDHKISPELKRLLNNLNPLSTNTQNLLIEITNCIEEQNKNLIAQNLEIFAASATRFGLAHMLYGMIAYQTAAATTFFTGTSQTTIAELISSLGDSLNALGQSEMLVSAFIKAVFSLREGYDINALIKDLKRQQQTFPNDSTALAIDRLITFKNSEKISRYIDSIGNGLLANGQGLMLLAGAFGIGGVPVSVSGVALTITGVVISQANALHWNSRSNVINASDKHLESIQALNTSNDSKSIKESIETRLNHYIALSESRALPKLWLERCLLIMDKPNKPLDTIQHLTDNKNNTAKEKDMRGIPISTISNLSKENKKSFDQSLNIFHELFLKSPIKAENYFWRQLRCFMAYDNLNNEGLEIAKIPTTDNTGVLLKESNLIANLLHDTTDELYLGYQKERRIIKQYVNSKYPFIKASGKALTNRHIDVIEIETKKQDWAIPSIIPNISIFIPTPIKNAYHKSKSSLQDSLLSHPKLGKDFKKANEIQNKVFLKIKSIQAYFSNLLPERTHITRKKLLTLSLNFYNDLDFISDMNSHLSITPGDKHFKEILSKKITQRKVELLETLKTHPEMASSIAKQHIALNQLPEFYTLSKDGTQLVPKEKSAKKLLKKVLDNGIESGKVNGKINDKLASFWGHERRNPIFQTIKNDLASALDSNVKRAALATETTMIAYSLLQQTIQQEIEKKSSFQYLTKTHNIVISDEAISRMKKYFKARSSVSIDALDNTINLWIYSIHVGNAVIRNQTEGLIKEMARLSKHLNGDNIRVSNFSLRSSLLALEEKMINLHRQNIPNRLNSLSPFLVKLFDGKIYKGETTLNADYIQHWLGIQNDGQKSTELLLSLKSLQAEGVKFVSNTPGSDSTTALMFRISKTRS